LAEFPPLYAGNGVMLRETAVEHREIRGYEIRQAQVVFEDFCEKQLAFPDHRGFEHVVEFGVEKLARLGEVDFAEAQPLADEIPGERRRLRVPEHPLDLRAQDVWVM